jgi:hypothetical protein
VRAESRRLTALFPLDVPPARRGDEKELEVVEVREMVGILGREDAGEGRGEGGVPRARRRNTMPNTEEGRVCGQVVPM